MKKYLYVVDYKFKKMANKEIVTMHIDYLRKLDDEGKLVLCGVFKGCSNAMIIIRADSEEEAEQIFNVEPMVDKGYYTFTLRPFVEANKENNYLL